MQEKVGEPRTNIQNIEERAEKRREQHTYEKREKRRERGGR